jgi:hypothetical protein
MYHKLSFIASIFYSTINDLRMVASFVRDTSICGMHMAISVKLEN